MALAKGFALPHLPRMPELKRADTSDFVPHSTPPSLIPFKNKAREKARQAKLAREGEFKPVLSSDLLSIYFLLSAQAGKKSKKPTLVSMTWSCLNPGCIAWQHFVPRRVVYL